MKVAVSSTGKNLEDKVADVFGRCPYFMIIEIKNKKIIKTQALKNINAEQMGGAGVLAAQALAEKNVNAIISNNIGPRALEALNQFKIKIYQGNGSIEKVIKELINSNLKKIN